MSKVIGILGGMGPLATVDLFEKIIKNTPAKYDQDHPRIIIENNPKIPSRIKAILEGTDDPLPSMRESIQLLERAGADFIIIPCHTAHFWIKELREAVKIPVYSIIDFTVLHIKKVSNQEPRRILLWASTATVKQGLYHKAFNDVKISLIVPNQLEQKIIALTIDEVKKGQVRANPHIGFLNNQLLHYKSREGITSVLAGCTEISLLFPYIKDTIEKIDPTLILAKEAVTLSK